MGDQELQNIQIAVRRGRMPKNNPKLQARTLESIHSDPASSDSLRFPKSPLPFQDPHLQQQR